MTNRLHLSVVFDRQFLYWNLSARVRMKAQAAAKEGSNGTDTFFDFKTDRFNPTSLIGVSLCMRPKELSHTSF